MTWLDRIAECNNADPGDFVPLIVAGQRVGGLRGGCRFDVPGHRRREEPRGCRDAVEAHVEGHPDRVEELLSWFEDGPSGARVDVVDVRMVEFAALTSFEIQ